MTIKDELMVVVRAFNALINGDGTKQQLKDAQDQIASLKAADQVNDAEQAEIDKALAAAAAATPGSETGTTGSTGATGTTGATGGTEASAGTSAVGS